MSVLMTLLLKYAQAGDLTKPLTAPLKAPAPLVAGGTRPLKATPEITHTVPAGLTFAQPSTPATLGWSTASKPQAQPLLLDRDASGFTNYVGNLHREVVAAPDKSTAASNFYRNVGSIYGARPHPTNSLYRTSAHRTTDPALPFSRKLLAEGVRSTADSLFGQTKRPLAFPTNEPNLRGSMKEDGKLFMNPNMSKDPYRTGETTEPFNTYIHEITHGLGSNSSMAPQLARFRPEDAPAAAVSEYPAIMAGHVAQMEAGRRAGETLLSSRLPAQLLGVGTGGLPAALGALAGNHAASFDFSTMPKPPRETFKPDAAGTPNKYTTTPGGRAVHRAFLDAHRHGYFKPKSTRDALNVYPTISGTLKDMIGSGVKTKTYKNFFDID